MKNFFKTSQKSALAAVLLICCLLSNLTSSAQTAVRGKITSEGGKPLSSVSVLVKGTTRGTTTNDNGEFSIQASNGDVLVLSSVGYAIKEIKVGKESTLKSFPYLNQPRT